MNDILVSLFRAISGFIAWVAILVSFGIGTIMVMTASNPVQAPIGYAIMIGGPVFSILIFGTVALMIQNNDLLREIARSKGAPRSSPEGAISPTKEPRHRPEPALRGKK